MILRLRNALAEVLGIHETCRAIRRSSVLADDQLVERYTCISDLVQRGSRPVTPRGVQQAITRRVDVGALCSGRLGVSNGELWGSKWAYDCRTDRGTRGELAWDKFRRGYADADVMMIALT